MKSDCDRLADIQAARAQDMIARIKAEDQRRIAAGELRERDMFFISREAAESSRVKWNFCRKREAAR